MTETVVPQSLSNLRRREEDAHAPKMLSHLALVTHDVKATNDFYTRCMRMPLAAAVMHERVPSTGEIMPYLHVFFRMQDGSTIAFFEAPDLPLEADIPHPAYKIFNHIALEAETTESVDEWKTWLVDQGVEVLGPVDHTIIYSIYFYDPNGNRLEITTPLVEDWNDRGGKARDAVDAWVATKEKAIEQGASVSEALYDLIVAAEPVNFD